MPGVTAEFRNNMYETENQEIIDQLKKTRGYGRLFVSDEEKPELSKETIREMNEKQSVTDGIGFTCRKCGFVAKNDFGLQSHMRSHAND